jgi:hypothetical protein
LQQSTCSLFTSRLLQRLFLGDGSGCSCWKRQACFENVPYIIHCISHFFTSSVSQYQSHSFLYLTSQALHFIRPYAAKFFTMSSPSSSTPTTRAPSITAQARDSRSPNPTHSLKTFSLKAALKKPFQGWSRDLLRARDNDDDDYNFASGPRRGYEPNTYRNDA